MAPLRTAGGCCSVSSAWNKEGNFRRRAGAPKATWVDWHSSSRYVGLSLPRRCSKLLTLGSKPANLFLQADRGAPFPRVLLGDFGQAIRDDNINWRREMMVGDPAWSPPEYPNYTYESDVWSIGVTMQAACAMRSFTVYHTGTQAVLGTCEHFSRNLNRVMLSTMRVHPQDRPDIMELARRVGVDLRDESERHSVYT